MKIKKEHFEHLNTEIKKTLEKHNVNNKLVEDYEAGRFPRAEKTKDLQTRFCFDLLFASIPSSYICDTLYKYLNDDHIYTALKKICPKVERKF